MKNTCIVKVFFDGLAQFYPRADDSSAYVPVWPADLRQKFRGAGVYSIRRVLKPNSRSVSVDITGSTYGQRDCVPAFFVDGRYGLCARFLRELGVKPPVEGRVKTFHLTVRKR